MLYMYVRARVCVFVWKCGDTVRKCAKTNEKKKLRIVLNELYVSDSVHMYIFMCVCLWSRCMVHRIRIINANMVLSFPFERCETRFISFVVVRQMRTALH